MYSLFLRKLGQKRSKHDLDLQPVFKLLKIKWYEPVKWKSRITESCNIQNNSNFKCQNENFCMSESNFLYILY